MHVSNNVSIITSCDLAHYDSMNVVLEFSGGAELLFGKTRQHKVQLPLSESKWTIGRLLAWIKDNILEERPELFLKDPSSSHLDVRPGILVLVNDSDWELLGQTEYELEVRQNGLQSVDFYLFEFVLL